MDNSFFGMFNQMQEKMEEAKKRLDTITVTGETDSGNIKVTVTGNRQIKEISIADHSKYEKEELEELLVTALNRGLENAEKVNDSEMKGSASGFLPPDMNGLFG
jgi:nucleoid-associated protein EbfC